MKPVIGIFFAPILIKFYPNFYFYFQLLSAYLSYCGIAIYNAQIFEAYSKEYERNKVSTDETKQLSPSHPSPRKRMLKCRVRMQWSVWKYGTRIHINVTCAAMTDGAFW